MTGTDQGDPMVEKFAPNGGVLTSVFGTVLVLGAVGVWIFDMDAVPIWVPAVALLVGVVIYVSTIRPRVLVQGRTLVLRNMFTDVHLPLAAVEEIAVRQVMAVRAGGRRYVCAGVGRSMRQAMKGSSVQRAREQMGGLRGEMAKAAVREPGMSYADFVEIRIQELVNEDRMRRGIKRYSPEADELATQVRRETAWPEVVVVVAVVVFFAIAVLVG